VKKILLGSAWHDHVSTAQWGGTFKTAIIWCMQGFLGGWPLSASQLQSAKSEPSANILLVDRDCNIHGLFPIKEVLRTCWASIRFLIGVSVTSFGSTTRAG
jgi:hypothetical protein